MRTLLAGVVLFLVACELPEESEPSMEDCRKSGGVIAYRVNRDGLESPVYCDRKARLMPGVNAQGTASDLNTVDCFHRGGEVVYMIDEEGESFPIYCSLTTGQ